MVRIAQGLLHMGKGLVTLNPFHSDNELLRKVTCEIKLDAFTEAFPFKVVFVSVQAGIGSLLCIFHSAFNPAATLLGKVSTTLNWACKKVVVTFAHCNFFSEGLNFYSCNADVCCGQTYVCSSITSSTLSPPLHNREC